MEVLLGQLLHPTPTTTPHPTQRGYLDGVCRAVRDDAVNLSAYFAWSLLDNLEWNEGYRPLFGLVHVDRRGRGLRRYPKLSAYWLSHHFFKNAPEEIACLGGWRGVAGACFCFCWAVRVELFGCRLTVTPHPFLHATVNLTEIKSCGGVEHSKRRLSAEGVANKIVTEITHHPLQA
jgi:hypothetical protein